MSKSYFFYDLETSGFSPRRDRIMQFAGIRVDEKLDPIPGEEYNYLIYLAEDILPSPTAIMTTHITPQKTRESGYSEADFARIFADKIAVPDTTFVGYNNIRFDDEHMRNFLWRNFRDPYEWEWRNGCSRWDLLDVVRLVRALRPEGISWPMLKIASDKGEIREISSNKLELLSALNKFPHRHAHDALSDVEDTINLAKLIRDKQPKIFEFMMRNHDKKSVATIMNLGHPFVYASGRLPADNEKTSVMIKIGDTDRGDIISYDLRIDPADLVGLSEEQMLGKLMASWQQRCDPEFAPLPIKEIAINKCPAVAPIGTLDAASQKRVNLDMKTIERNLANLRSNQSVIDKMLAAFAQRRDAYSRDAPKPEVRDVEDRLYDSLMPDADRAKIRAVASAGARDLADFHPDFVDERLLELLLRYKARNFPNALSADESATYEKWRLNKLQREAPAYFQELDYLAFFAKSPDVKQIDQFTKRLDEKSRSVFDQIRTFVDASAKLGRSIDESILTELRLWAESIQPYDDAGDGDFAA